MNVLERVRNFNETRIQRDACAEILIVCGELTTEYIGEELNAERTGRWKWEEKKADSLPEGVPRLMNENVPRLIPHLRLQSKKTSFSLLNSN